MATHASAKKRIRQTARRTLRNHSARSEVRTAIKKVMAALQGPKPEEAKALVQKAERLIAKAASRGLYHPKKASRTISRLYAKAQKK